MTDSYEAPKRPNSEEHFIGNIVEQLIDISRRNPSLNYRSSKAAIVASQSADVFDLAYPTKSKLNITDVIGSEPTTEQMKTLRNLAERSRLLLEERGVHVLRFAIGFVQWEDKSSNKSYNAPILFAQVELSKVGASYTLTRTDGSDLEANREFLELLKRHPASRPTLLRSEPASFEEALIELKAAMPTDAVYTISTECHLGLFSYEKLVMVHDIEENKETILKHPLIAALNGDPNPLALSQHGIELPSSIELDQATANEDRVFIYEADSTQQEALEGIARGLSLVIQGPPGTGKSQTIVNVIAQALFDGKSVLFVAEKKVALDVVQQRLEAQGLGDAVLAVQKDADKKRFAVSLAARHAELSEVSEFDADFKTTTHAIQELNAYKNELHTPLEANKDTPYKLYGRTSKNISATPPVRIDGVEHISADSKELIGELIEKLSDYPSWLRAPQDAVWFSLRTEVDSLEAVQSIYAAMVTARDTAFEAASIVNQSMRIVGSSSDSSQASLIDLRDWLSLLALSPVVPSVWLTIKHERAAVSLAKYEQDRKQYDGEQISLGARYKSSVFDSDLDDLTEKFMADYQHFWKRWFNKSYATDTMSILEERLDEHRRMVYGELRDELLTLRSLKTQRAAWSSSSHEMRIVFGGLFSGADTSISDMRAAVDWFRRFDAKRSSTATTRTLELSLTSDDLEIRRVAADLAHRLSQIIKTFEQCAERLQSVLSDVPNDRLAWSSYFERRINAIDEVPRYLNFRHWAKQLKSLGCARLLERFRDDSSLTPDAWRTLFNRVFDASLIDFVHRTRPALASFDREAHERLRQRFAILDEENVCSGSKRVASRIIRTARAKMKSEDYFSAINIVAKEATKSRNVMAIRSLTRAAFPAIQVIKPCWMMSPLAVSQYLPAGMIFDIVVFDEASQMRPADAVAAVSRAKQVVVVGDNKQLPPTSFFDNAISEAETERDEDQIDIADYESILDQCSSVLQQRMLRWHYRSKDESLIAFSNKKFYEGRLVTFPSPLKRKGLGVRLAKVDGTYSRGGSRQNRAEAQEVARLAYEHAKVRANETLGIIAFSQAQQHAIEDALEKAGEANPSDRDFFLDSRPASERVFVKNLESVQGDERDVILLSVGYGRDADGRLAYNFGPLNSSGGGRRLNVAVTRAKSEMIVVSSIDDRDMDPSKCQEGGASLVRSYLEFARLGGNTGGSSTYTGRGVDSPFEEDVRLVLSDAGHKVDLQVGVSGYRIDLAVRHPQRPGEYVLAVECDGATYHSSPTARDRDRLRDRTLKTFGWRVHRIWSRDWFRRRQDEIRRLFAAVEEAYVLAEMPVESTLPEPPQIPSPVSPAKNNNDALLNSASAAVLACLERSSQELTKKELTEISSLPEVLVKFALEALIEKGAVRKIGIGRGTRYLKK